MAGIILAGVRVWALRGGAECPLAVTREAQKTSTMLSASSPLVITWYRFSTACPAIAEPTAIKVALAIAASPFFCSQKGKRRKYGKPITRIEKNLQFTQYAPPKSDKSCRLVLRSLT
jgi:hypothetical protein